MGSSPERSRARAGSSRRRLRRVLLVTVASLLLLVTAGLLIRVPRPDREGIDIKFDPRIGWVPALQAGATGVRLEQTVGQRRELFDASRRSILMVGDSVTYAQGLAHEQTASRRLDRAIRDYQVLNLGVTGYSIDQYYLYLQRLLPRLNPRLIVVNIFTPNDYQGTTVENYYGYAKPLFRKRGDRLVLVKTPLPEVSCSHHLSHSLLFYPLWHWGAARQNQGGREKVLELVSSLCLSTTLELQEGQQVVTALLHKIVELGNKRSADVLFVLLPNQHNLADARGLEQLDRFPWPTLKFFRGLLSRLEYNTLDFAHQINASKFCASHKNRHGQCDYKALFLDGGHMSARGSQLLAESLRRYLRDRYQIR